MRSLRLNSALIIQKIIEDKVFFSDLKSRIDPRCISTTNMIILTTLRNWVGLRKALYSFLDNKIPNKYRLAEYLLIQGMAELLFMGTAHYAVIDETVDQVKRNCGKSLSGLVNAVLRNVIAHKAELRTRVHKSDLMPEEFRAILKDYGKVQIKKINGSIAWQPWLDVSVKDNARYWAKKLSGDLLPNGSLRVKRRIKIERLPGYEEGQWWVQDAAAAMPVQVMGWINGLNVIDLCAAPGGKTAQLLARGARVTALDVSQERMETLQQNMNRLGYHNLRTKVIDAAEYMQTTKESYDAVLLDAPCSATGTLRRHPEVIHIKTQDDVDRQIQTQRKLLSLCSNILRVGGILVYSVCSISKDEGEKQIEWFLQEHKEFKIVPITLKEISTYGKWHENPILPNGTIRTLPYFEKDRSGIDSFFICKMQRII